ncbi:MAG: hypothetical protein M0P70_02610 [Desulfobulbaceae bacterium]|nr:hypothetical protein [Desulfobulbaceae bacterium]
MIWIVAKCLPLLFLLALGPTPPLCGADAVTAAGRLKLTVPYATERDSVREEPGLSGRLVLDAEKEAGRLHLWLEGGWDGTVRGPQQDHDLLKNLGEVYQGNTPYLEIKELYGERSLAAIDWRIGIQRFSWGRLDEFPVNDLFNPWDYRQFIVKSLEERKIGVPAVSASLNREEWNYQLVWAPWQVPYRLPDPDERWAVLPARALFPDSPGAEVIMGEPELPARTLANGSFGLRLQRLGDIDWAVNLFHGFDPRPVFATTALRVSETGSGKIIDPGLVPSFHRITSLGLDGAAVLGDWSLRGEAAATLNRGFNLHPELWGYPAHPAAGVTELPDIELTRDTLDYGLAGDFRLVEDAILTLQAQQTLIIHRPGTLYDRSCETLLWVNLRVYFLNQKLETTVNPVYNPEHGASMLRAGITYVINDAWKTSLTGLILDGPPASLFGRYAANDQLGLELVYAW